ncbi:CHAT domain-containing protein [Humibacillus xanthopallidus]|uniref:CHAT domain-containing protein n=1 Tax=Humibacillus xanthopallidus TaxID=412689 RepID=A0A543HHJ4_9MICO|nr:CHAT domain-containing protein [Humibacillus xanthopallidus]TQM57796.1 CHAT domain-containing protein [Humibacillus xanthopallidus]
MPGHPIDVMVDELVRAAVRVAPGLEAPLRQLSAGDRHAATRALTDPARPLGVGGSADEAADEAAVAAAFARLSRLLALVGLPDGGARQMVQLAGSVGEVDADLEPTLRAMSLATPPVRTLCELAALEVPGLLQWQAMLPPNNPWAGETSLAVLDRVAAAGASLVASAEAIDPRTGQIARLWLADIDRRAARWEQAMAAARSVESVAADREVQGYVELLRGDWAAAPLSSPAAWNCSFQPVIGQDGSIGGLEDREGAVGLDLGAAAQAWDRAAALLVGPTWTARLALRRTWLRVATGDAVGAVEQAEASLAAYRTAGDPAGRAVAAAHLCLARLAAGRLPADTALATDTATGAAQRVGAATVLGLAQLCSRVSRLWRVSAVAAEPALAALDLSEALARPAGLTEHLTRCTIDRAQVLASVGSTRRARLLIEEAISSVAGATSEAATSALSTELGLLLLQLYGIAVVDRDGAQMHAVAQRYYSEPSVVAALGAQLPQAGTDAVALAYEGERRSEEGDEEGASRLLDKALGVATTTNPGALLAVLASRHEHAAAADVMAASVQAQLAANAAGDLGIGHGDGAGGALSSLPAEVIASMLELQRRRILLQGFSALVRLRDPDRAAPLLADLEASARDAPWWSGIADEVEARLAAGLLKEGQGDRAAASVELLAGLRAADLRRSTISDDELRTAVSSQVVVADLVRTAARVALDDGRPAEAAELAMRGQARALVDLVSRGTARRRKPVADGDPPDSAAAGADADADADEDDAVATWRGANADLEIASRRLLFAIAADAGPDALARLRAERDEAQRAARSAQEQLAGLDPDHWRTVNPAAAPVSVEDVAASLAPDAVLLQLLVAAGEVLVWVIGPAGVLATHHARDVWSLAGAASRFRAACADGLPSTTDAEALAEQLLVPVADALRAAREVVVVASGPTTGMPFHALPLDGAPLGDRHVVRYLPSASLVTLTGASAAGPDPTSWEGALVVGDPEAMSLTDPVSGLSAPASPLPGARVEAAHVAATLPDAHLLLGPEATEDAVRAGLGAAPVVHLATHGLLDRDNPQASCVLLADGAALEAGEIAGLTLRARLVVLSACHSGEGGPAGGDELLGLARAVLSSGAGAVVVTLWAVDDRSSALLMGRFYERLLAGADPATALHDAQQWLRGLDSAAARTAYGRLSEEVSTRPGVDATAVAQRRVTPVGSSREPARGPVGYAHPRHWAAFALVGG